jgi:S-adenosylmethionine hydrolase
MGRWLRPAATLYQKADRISQQNMSRTDRTRIITLMTDFGVSDPYVGEVKGAILSRCPSATLVDITHDVHPFNVRQGAFLLRLAYKFFPPGTIHLAVVDPGVGTERRGIVIRTRHYWFVGPDNGLLYPAASQDDIERCFQIRLDKYQRVGGETFHARDVFGPVAGEIAAGSEPGLTEIQRPSIVKMEITEAKFVGGQAEVEVLHVDRFGNVILNIGAEGVPKDLRIDDKLLIEHDKGAHTAVYARSYGEVAEGALLATFGGTGLLELAVNKGNAASRLKLQPGSRLLLRTI